MINSKTLANELSCPTIPWPVIASVATARMNPIIAARPLSCSENGVKPCGTDLSSPSSAIEKRAARRRTTATLLFSGTLDVTNEETVATGDRAVMGVAETKAVVFMVNDRGWLVGLGVVAVGNVCGFGLVMVGCDVVDGSGNEDGRMPRLKYSPSGIRI